MQHVKPVLYTVVYQHIAVITLNRPESRNAINAQMSAMIEEYLLQIEADPSIWVGVLAANGGQTFCAGADLKEIMNGREKEIATQRGGLGGFVHAPKRTPWIAAVEGSALGGGLELCLACDMVVCADGSQFGLPEVRRGLVALAGGLYRLPRAVPRAVALEMIATGRPISAQRALSIGLVNKVVAESAVLSTALDLAREVCLGAPVAVQESIALARLTDDMAASDMWELGERTLKRVQSTEDFMIGIKAFSEKKIPQWSGR